MAGPSADPLLTQPVSDDNSPLEPLNAFDFDTFLPIYGSDLLSPTGRNMHLSNPDVASQKSDCYARPHNHGVPTVHPQLEVGSPPISSTPESRSMEVAYDIHNPKHPKDQFQGLLYDEPSRQYQAIPIIGSAAISRADVMTVTGPQYQPITPVVGKPQHAGSRSVILHSMPYPSLMDGSTHRLSKPTYDRSTWFSTSAAEESSKLQSYQALRAPQNHPHTFPAIDDCGFSLFMDPVGLFSHSLYNSTDVLDQIPEQQYNHYTPYWSALAQITPYSETETQRRCVASIATQPSPPQPLLTDRGVSTLEYTTHDDFPLHERFGNDILRTNSPEPIKTIFNEEYGLGRVNMVDPDCCAPRNEPRRRHCYDGKVATRSTGSGSTGSGSTGSGSTGSGSSSASNFPSTQQPSGKLTYHKNARTKTRTLTPAGLEDYRYTRRNGACVSCNRNKKQCSPPCDEPCNECKRLVGTDYRLARAICYRKNFEHMLVASSDCFGIKQRRESIKAEIESMCGPECDFLLGGGLRFRHRHAKFITIDIDPDPLSVLSVKVQDTKPEFRETWVSTKNRDETSGTEALLDRFPEKSYAIVPKYLPKISDLDKWGRRDIVDQAANWPDDLEAAYDLLFLRYCEVTPQLPCYDIVDDTMRILSLGQFLDSRRPIDHNAATSFLQSFFNNPPTRFGIKEFNKCHAEFQLSMPARTQLYILAAQGIQYTQQQLGRKIDNLFQMKRDELSRQSVFLVGTCLRRLGLEYRQRLERYREFPAGQMHERIETCRFMYTLFTRVYDLWYRGSDSPMFPDWHSMNFSDVLGDNLKLVRAFADLSHLEMEFCNERLNDGDKFYQMLIVDRVLRKSPKI